MAKVITFSRQFPAYHPKAGQQTGFVEKIWKSLYVNGVCPDELNGFINNYGYDFSPYYETRPKFHTIRTGNRWKVGDKFSPRVWSGKPYNSKMITIAPDIEIKKTWDFEIKKYQIFINGKLFYHQHVTEWHSDLERLALNDGLTCVDMFSWFKIPCDFTGQIISWNENINY